MCYAEDLELRKQNAHGIGMTKDMLRQRRFEPISSNNANDSVVNNNNNSLVSDRESSSSSSSLVPIFVYIIVTVGMKEFSAFFPQIQSEASRKTFLSASYNFDGVNTYFDNTIWTWGTDYLLSVLMIYGAFKCLYATRSETGETNVIATRPIRLHAFALLFGYSISCFCGAVAHQTYLTLDSLNTPSFRALWTLCVGNVTFANTFMGMAGADICRKLNQPANKHQILFRVPIIPSWAWLLYGGYMTYSCWCGDLSCKRPACDIFIAGITQLIPTLYCEIVMLSRRWSDASSYLEAKATSKDVVADGIRVRYRLMFYIGFLLNAPLLFIYPLAVQYTSLSLGTINAMLHSNLCLAWGMQAMSLHHIAKALNRFPKNS